MDKSTLDDDSIWFKLMDLKVLFLHITNI